MKEDCTPKSVGLIMDGNGRWALDRNDNRLAGHTAGMMNMISLVAHAFDRGVHNMICYGLSTENMSRPLPEVEHIFELVVGIYDYFISTFKKIGACVKYVGNLTALPQKVQLSLKRSEKDLEQFAGNDKTLYVGIAYGSRHEIVSAVNAAVERGERVTEESFMSSLSVPIVPDMIIRTGGERRLSNFLLYQASYSELYFSDKLFPDFTVADFDEALKWYASRNRTYGTV